MTETIGQVIRRLRKERNLTQEELAEQLNISAPAISKWENDTTMPDISQIVPLASIFEVSTDVGYLLQALEDNAARLGTAYHQNGQYHEAIAVLEAVFDIMKAVFKQERPAPFHDFDSGDCYLLLARSYLALGETNKALDMLEDSIMFYLNQYEPMSENRTRFQTPLLREDEVLSPMKLSQKALKEKLSEKLHAKEIEALKETKRYQELCEKVSLVDI